MRVPGCTRPADFSGPGADAAFSVSSASAIGAGRCSAIPLLIRGIAEDRIRAMRILELD